MPTLTKRRRDGGCSACRAVFGNIPYHEKPTGNCGLKGW